VREGAEPRRDVLRLTLAGKGKIGAKWLKINNLRCQTVANRYRGTTGSSKRPQPALTVIA
jgi:hypothetical protein